MAKILYVEVNYDSASNSLAVNPENLAMPPGTLAVVWWPTNLPPGRLLDIRFLGPASGPFISLVPQGDLVIGSGNTGQPQKYPYEVLLTGPEPVGPGAGKIINASQEQASDHPVRCVQNPSGPPICYED